MGAAAFPFIWALTLRPLPAAESPGWPLSTSLWWSAEEFAAGSGTSSTSTSSSKSPSWPVFLRHPLPLRDEPLASWLCHASAAARKVPAGARLSLCCPDRGGLCCRVHGYWCRSAADEASRCRAEMPRLRCSSNDAPADVCAGTCSLSNLRPDNCSAGCPCQVGDAFAGSSADHQPVLWYRSPLRKICILPRPLRTKPGCNLMSGATSTCYVICQMHVIGHLQQALAAGGCASPLQT